MHRPYRLTEKRDIVNAALEKPMTRKSRLDNRITSIVTLDNGTTVEVFKYLKYCGIAKTSLVSKRFCDLISTHRHMLALLDVESINMTRLWHAVPTVIKIFNNELSTKEYCAWIVCNNYSKHIPLEGQFAGEQSLKRQVYEFSGDADYKETNRERTSVFYARAKELNNETWPLFHHFVRLLTDPFVYIRAVKLAQQTDIFNLLAKAIDRSNRARLQCGKLEFDFDGSNPKFFDWIKDHVRCVEFFVRVSNSGIDRDEQLLDFFATGSQCTSEIVMLWHIPKDLIVNLVQKFIGLKNCDESHFVHSIRGTVTKRTIEALTSTYEEFSMKGLKDRVGWTPAHVFEFVNVDIGKKFQLIIADLATRQIKLEIIHL